MAEIEVGRITHYFGNIGVAGVKLSGPLSVGETVHILGHTTDMILVVESIHINHERFETAEAGAEIGLKVADHVREHDTLYKVGEGQDG